MELRSKRDDLKACTYVGKHVNRSSFLNIKRHEWRGYCCYSGPFARIMQQQIRAANEPPLDFGSAPAPDCEGLTIQQIQDTDWSQVDLSEWREIVFEHGLQPTEEEYEIASQFEQQTRNEDDEDVWVPPDARERNDGITSGFEMNEAARDIDTQAHINRDDAGYPTEAPY